MNMVASEEVFYFMMVVFIKVFSMLVELKVFLFCCLFFLCLRSWVCLLYLIFFDTVYFVFEETLFMNVHSVTCSGLSSF